MALENSTDDWNISRKYRFLWLYKIAYDMWHITSSFSSTWFPLDRESCLKLLYLPSYIIIIGPTRCCLKNLGTKHCFWLRCVSLSQLNGTRAESSMKKSFLNPLFLKLARPALTLGLALTTLSAYNSRHSMKWGNNRVKDCQHSIGFSCMSES